MQFPEIAFLTREAGSLRVSALFATALTISLVLSGYFLPMYLDDSLISYRYAQRLLDGNGLTWNDGEYVEGYSNLLWVLLVAGGGVLHRDLIQVGWMLGLSANVAALAAIAWAFAGSSRDSVLPTAAGLAVLALSPAFAFWGVAGMESALFAAILAWALAIAHRAPTGRWAWICAGVLLGLLAICRPDGVLLAVGVACGLVLRGGANRTVWRRAATIVVIAVAFVAAQLLFRILYYGDLVPNTAYAKLGFTLERVWLGLLYVMHGMLMNGVAMTILALALFLLAKLRLRQAVRDQLVFIVPAALWLGYVSVIGGDFFPYDRHWMPALACLAFALAGSLAALPRFQSRLVTSAFAGAVLIHLVLQLSVNPWYVPKPSGAADDLVEQEYKEWAPNRTEHPVPVVRRDMEECMVVGRMLGDAFAVQRPLIAVNYAGCMPYASQLPALDMLGLTDSRIARDRPTDIGHGRLGHELGNGAYVLSRKPDLVVFCVPATGNKDPCLRSDLEMAALPEFQRDYRLVRYGAGRVNGSLWTRIEDGRIGIERTPDAIHIPGYLLATEEGVRAVLDTEGTPVAALERGEAVIADVFFPPGTWEVSLQADAAADVQLAASPSDGTSVLHQHALRVESPGSARSLRVFGGRGLIYSVTAKRVTAR